MPECVGGMPVWIVAIDLSLARRLLPCDRARREVTMPELAQFRHFLRARFGASAATAACHALMLTPCFDRGTEERIGDVVSGFAGGI